MKDVAELLVGDISLPEYVVVLEELEKADAILLAQVLDLDHQGDVIGVVSCEVGPFLDIR